MDEFLWRRMLGLEGSGSGETWLAVAFLVSLFAVAIWQPQRISRPYLFHMAYFLFALYFLLPAFADIIVRIAVLDSTPPPAFRTGDPRVGAIGWGSSVVHLLGKIVFAISMVCAFGSLGLRQRKWREPDVDEGEDSRSRKSEEKRGRESY
jgi:hypothetical protein